MPGDLVAIGADDGADGVDLICSAGVIALDFSCLLRSGVEPFVFDCNCWGFEGALLGLTRSEVVESVAATLSC